MRPPIKNLIGGVKELHTRDYLLKISALTVCCRERSKIVSKNSKNARTGAELMFLEREERGGRRHTWRWGLWAQAPCGRGQGAGRASWPPGPLVAPPGQPQVPLGHFSRGKFDFYFCGIFLTTSLLKKFRGSKSCETFWKLEAVVRNVKLQKHKNLVQQG